MDIAKLFQIGRSQALRLPKECRFEGDRVVIKRIGNAVVLLPLDNPWQVLEKGLERFSADYMKNRRQPKKQQRRGRLFARG